MAAALGMERLSRASVCQKFRREPNVRRSSAAKIGQEKAKKGRNQSDTPNRGAPGCKMENQHAGSGSAGCRSDPDPMLGAG